MRLFENALTLAEQARLFIRDRAYQEVIDLLQDQKNEYEQGSECDYFLGTAFLQTQQYKQAIEYLTRRIQAADHDVPARQNLSLALFYQGELKSALQQIDLTLERAGETAPILNIKGLIVAGLGDVECAESIYQRALSLQTDHVGALNNLANLYFQEARLSEAQALLVDADTESLELGLLRANVQYRLGHHAQADTLYDALLKKHPNNADVRFNRSIYKLAARDWSQAWADYRYRLMAATSHIRLAQLPLPVMSSLDDLKTKRVLVRLEQGVGDQILFAGVLSALIANGYDRFSVSAETRLLVLLQRSFPSLEFLSEKEAHTLASAQRFDYQIAIGDVCYALAYRPSGKPYLQADKEQAMGFRKAVQSDAQTVVGFSWRSFGSARIAYKNTRLDDWLPLFKLPNIHWVCMQYGDVEQEVQAFAQMHGIDISIQSTIDTTNDLDTLASRLIATDLFISTPNATADLSAALGHNTLVLLSASPDWRWGWDGEQSDIYANTRMIRQLSLGDWQTVFEKAKAVLENKLE